MSNTRIAPHNIEAEEAVLGSILIDPEALLDVQEFLGGQDFFIVRNGWIFEACVELHERGEPIDYLSVVSDLRRREKLKEVGGPGYISGLIEKTPTAIHVESYGKQVYHAAIRRRGLDAIGDMARAMHNEREDIDGALERASIAWGAIEDLATRNPMQSMNDVMSECYDMVADVFERQGAPVGIPTGFSAIDNIMGGFQRDDLVIVAGRPGMGKSSWLFNVALNIARRGTPVATFSLEMSNAQLGQRLVAIDTGINSQTLRRGPISETEWDRFVNGAGRLGNLPLYMDDTPGLSIVQLRTKARRVWMRHRTPVIFIDYLQLMNAPSRRDGRVQEVTTIVQGLKRLARELGITIVAAAQLNRGVEQRNNKRPLLSDLRESGAIEQEADVVAFLYRDDYYDEASEKPNIAEFIVAKHRNGPTGTAELYFKKELTQFTDLVRRRVNLDNM